MNLKFSSSLSFISHVIYNFNMQTPLLLLNEITVTTSGNTHNFLYTDHTVCYSHCRSRQKNFLKLLDNPVYFMTKKLIEIIYIFTNVSYRHTGILANAVCILLDIYQSYCDIPHPHCTDHTCGNYHHKSQENTL